MPTVELLRGSERDRIIFHNLMQCYQYDCSEHSGDDPNAEGYFDYPWLEAYWTRVGQEEEGRIAYLIKADGKLAGFVLVNNLSYVPELPRDYTVAEFFVLRKWRRQGVGRQAAFELFRRHRGRWLVGQERTNYRAQAFWRAIIGEYTQGRFQEIDGQSEHWEGPMQSFDS